MHVRSLRIWGLGKWELLRLSVENKEGMGIEKRGGIEWNGKGLDYFLGVGWKNFLQGIDDNMSFIPMILLG